MTRILDWEMGILDQMIIDRTLEDLRHSPWSSRAFGMIFVRETLMDLVWQAIYVGAPK